MKEFYVRPEHRAAALPIFRELVAVSGARTIEAQTNDLWLSLMLHDCAVDLTSDTILFADAATTAGAETNLPRGRSRSGGQVQQGQYRVAAPPATGRNASMCADCSRPHRRLIIFDCDGVLVDSEPIINRVFVEMLAENGHSVDYDLTLREFSGATMADRLATMQQRLRWIPPPDFRADFDRRLLDALERELRPVPGVVPVLDSVECPWCVASNGSHSDIRTRLGLAGLLERFNPPLFSASDVAHAKPAPDLFLHAAAGMGAAPDRCTVVEDSLRGVQAAVAAGMTVFGLARLTSPGVLRAAGAIVFEDMARLPDLLRRFRG